MIRIVSIAYEEYAGEPNHWKLKEFSVGQIALFVGKNATGKSRLISVVNGLQKLISGEVKDLFASGEFKVTFASDEKHYQFNLVLRANEVESESLLQEGKTLYSRDAMGRGAIWSEKLGQNLEFEIPKNVLVINSKRDRIQHEFLEPLHEWAATVRVCQFGTTLGRDTLKSVPDLRQEAKDGAHLLDPSEIHDLYLVGFNRYGDAFDQAIIRDLCVLGYDVTEVGMEPFNIPQLKAVPLARLYVKERDLAATTSQLTMSQGMFRAFALAIQLNYCAFAQVPRTILIDDIGEGLDFERSKALVCLLIEKAKENSFQLLMTTNDRFVMNGVDLDHWCVIQRHGDVVDVVNKLNSPQIFEDFESLGLNNFDFFSTKFFETGLVG